MCEGVTHVASNAFASSRDACTEFEDVRGEHCEMRGEAWDRLRV